MRREYRGAAQSSVLTSALGGTTADLTIYCNDLTNWPTGINGRPFYVVIDRGKSNEEKILCASRSANTITVCNTAAAAATYRIGVMGSAGTPGASEWIVYDASVPANETVFLTFGLTLGNSDFVRVSSSANTVAFSASCAVNS